MTDTEADEATLTISQFGRMCQLSRKALRIYDDRGLLPPAHVDPDSGYRYYTRRQLATARHIRLLRLMEMPLDKFDHVTENGAQPAGDPVALYYGPVNEEDDTTYEIWHDDETMTICWPIQRFVAA